MRKSQNKKVISHSIGSLISQATMNFRDPVTLQLPEAPLAGHPCGHIADADTCQKLMGKCACCRVEREWHRPPLIVSQTIEFLKKNPMPDTKRNPRYFISEKELAPVFEQYQFVNEFQIAENTSEANIEIFFQHCDTLTNHFVNVPTFMMKALNVASQLENYVLICVYANRLLQYELNALNVKILQNRNKALTALELNVPKNTPV